MVRGEGEQGRVSHAAANVHQCCAAPEVMTHAVTQNSCCPSPCALCSTPAAAAAHPAVAAAHPAAAAAPTTTAAAAGRLPLLLLPKPPPTARLPCSSAPRPGRSRPLPQQPLTRWCTCCPLWTSPGASGRGPRTPPCQPAACRSPVEMMTHTAHDTERNGAGRQVRSGAVCVCLMLLCVPGHTDPRHHPTNPQPHGHLPSHTFPSPQTHTHTFSMARFAPSSVSKCTKP